MWIFIYHERILNHFTKSLFLVLYNISIYIYIHTHVKSNFFFALTHTHLHSNISNKITVLLGERLELTHFSRLAMFGFGSKLPIRVAWAKAVSSTS